MKYEINDDRSKLKIIVTPEEKNELREIPAGDDQGCGSIISMDKTMLEFLDPLVCNSELEWISPADTGDLTDAPMLGILGEDEIRERVIERWAFMDYQVRSVLEDLRDKGECIFVS